MPVLLCLVGAAAASVLDARLVLDVHVHDLGRGISLTSRAFNGSIPGPLLRVVPGDTLQLTLINALGVASGSDTAPGGGRKASGAADDDGASDDNTVECDSA
jgi:hypothetical protein